MCGGGTLLAGAAALAVAAHSGCAQDDDDYLQCASTAACSWEVVAGSGELPSTGNAGVDDCLARTQALVSHCRLLVELYVASCRAIAQALGAPAPPPDAEAAVVCATAQERVAAVTAGVELKCGFVGECPERRVSCKSAAYPTPEIDALLSLRAYYLTKICSNECPGDPIVAWLSCSGGYLGQLGDRWLDSPSCIDCILAMNPLQGCSDAAAPIADVDDDVFDDVLGVCPTLPPEP